jgi:hypothetical protein
MFLGRADEARALYLKYRGTTTANLLSALRDYDYSKDSKVTKLRRR